MAFVLGRFYCMHVLTVIAERSAEAAGGGAAEAAAGTAVTAAAE